MRTLIGSPSAFKRTAPQRQPPWGGKTCSARCPHPEERGTRVSKDEARPVASPFETAASRPPQGEGWTLIRRPTAGDVEHGAGGERAIFRGKPGHHGREFLDQHKAVLW